MRTAPQAYQLHCPRKVRTTDRSQGFTLIEVMVVIAIVAILVGVLIPVVGKVREVSRELVCTSRLRDLTTATNLYRHDHEQFPNSLRESSAEDIGAMSLPPGPPPASVSQILPHQMQQRLLNDLQPYLKYHPIADSLPAVQLPPNVQCPDVEDIAEGRELVSLIDPSLVAYYTGYAYCYIDPRGDSLVQTSVILKPAKVVNSAIPNPRGVLWADDLHWSLVPIPHWSYAHAKQKAKKPTGSKTPPCSFAEARSVQGQHRAYADGSVEWVPSNKIKLDLVPTIDQDGGATYRVAALYFWWF
jgi:prepilin-type N-terminal cleavage/methylation domain-containing protein